MVAKTIGCKEGRLRKCLVAKLTVLCLAFSLCWVLLVISSGGSQVASGLLTTADLIALVTATLATMRASSLIATLATLAMAIPLLSLPSYFYYPILPLFTIPFYYPFLPVPLPFHPKPPKASHRSPPSLPTQIRRFIFPRVHASKK